MFSPHFVIDPPRTVAENLRFRAKIYEACKNPGFAGAIRAKCAANILFYFNTFCWAYDPYAAKGLRHGLERPVPDRPIVTFPFQDRVILEIQHCIQTGQDCAIDKCRDMLATYMVLYTYLHGWSFNEGEQYKIGSRKEEEVDTRGNISTLFEKLRYQLARTPRFLLPENFKLEKHATYMRLINPNSDSMIVGEATNPNFSRGGRYTSILYDEFSAWEEYADEAWTAGSDATKCKIAVWTPKGAANKAAEIMRSNEVSHKIHLDWWLHPEKAWTTPEHLEMVKEGKIYDKARGYIVKLNPDQSKVPNGCYMDTSGRFRSEWYDGEVLRRSKSDIAENVDRDYLTSGNPFFEIAICDKNLRIMCRPPTYGDLFWVISPEFDLKGNCINLEKLKVEFVENSNGDYAVWEHPVKGYDNGYCAAADIAEGLEQGDFNSASVWKRIVEDEESKPSVVATMRNKKKSFETAEALVKLALYYERCYIAPERNKEGSGVIMQMYRIYRKIWHKEVLTRGFPEPQDKLGFETSNRHVKHAVMGELSKAIFDEAFTDYDEGFWSECLTFVNNDGVLEAQGKSRGQKCYDDRVMDRAIGWWMQTRIPPPVKHEAKKKGYKNLDEYMDAEVFAKIQQPKRNNQWFAS